MTTSSYTNRYLAAIIFFGLSGFLAFGARAQTYAEREADCITKHPTLSIDECERVAKREMRAAAQSARAKAEKPAAQVAEAESAAAASSGLWVPVLFFLGAGIYLLPAIVGQSRHHHQRTAIWVLNIFLGWTVLGWVASLVWAASATPGAPS